MQIIETLLPILFVKFLVQWGEKTPEFQFSKTHSNNLLNDRNETLHKDIEQTWFFLLKRKSGAQNLNGHIYYLLFRDWPALP